MKARHILYLLVFFSTTKASLHALVLKKLIIDSFSGVKARTHNVDKVFVLGIHAWEVMVDGTTDYEFDDGTKKVGKWASRQKYVDDNGELKIKEYQVQFVSPRQYFIRDQSLTFSSQVWCE